MLGFPFPLSRVGSENLHTLELIIQRAAHTSEEPNICLSGPEGAAHRVKTPW